MKVDTLNEMTPEMLDSKEIELREELFNLKFQHAIGKLENTSRLTALRKDIARVLTTKKLTISKEG